MSKSSINGLSVVHKKSGGKVVSDVPDVCITTVSKKDVQMAYVNQAESSDLDKGSKSVSMNGTSIALEKSVFSKSKGDEAGNKKGVKSGTIKGEAAFTTASSSVTIEGQGVGRQTDMMTMNDGNTVCSPGVMQSGVSVKPEEEGTYSLDVKVTYPSGAPLANAAFTLVDDKGGTLASGQLDNNGGAELSGLPNTTCFINCEESSDDFVVTQSLKPNDGFDSVPDTQALIDDAKGSKLPFWQFAANGKGTPWGAFNTSLYESDDFHTMLRNNLTIHFPFKESNRSDAALFDTILEVLAQDEILPEHACDLVVLIAPLVHQEGAVSRLLLTIEPEKTYSDLCAHMRYLGEGNPQDYLADFCGSRASEHADLYAQSMIALFDSLLDQFEYCRSQAQDAELSLIEADIQHHIELLSLRRSEVPEAMQNALNMAVDHLSELMGSGDEVEVTKPDNFGIQTASASGASAYVIVNTLKPPVYLPEHRYDAATFTFSG
ncbi:PAAR-like domain-containing protein [Vibrio sp. WXL210]|uniref:PAAR-like domain-containing protein n=1 Tax=Vibrio sp. WXL210 TaxID=3450709 RepID=UPI003EC922BE